MVTDTLSSSSPSNLAPCILQIAASFCDMADHQTSFRGGGSDNEIVLPKFKFSDNVSNAGNEPRHRLPPSLKSVRNQVTYERRPASLSDRPRYLKLPPPESTDYLALPPGGSVSHKNRFFGGQSSRRRRPVYDSVRNEGSNQVFPFTSWGGCLSPSDFYSGVQRFDNEDETDEIEHQQMLNHQAYIRKKQTTWKLEDATGVYFIKCDQTSAQWPQFDGSDGFRMTIMGERDRPGRLIAEFDVGVVTGLMRFTLPGQKSLPDDDCEDDEDVDDNALEEEEEEEEEEEKEKEEKEDTYCESDASSRSASWKRRPTTTGSRHVAKKSRSEPQTGTVPLKLLLTWRGREHGEGEIQVDTGSNRGAIQFSDARLLSFVGKMDFDIVGKGVEIEGFKIADVPVGKQPSLEWSEFSWGAHGREAVRMGH